MMAEREEDDDTEEAWMQLRPTEPLPSQCCGSGCSPCVFDLYHRDLARWEAARASKDRSLLRGPESQCYQMGLMSRYVESWRVGDTAFWRGPFGDFFYKPNQYGELLLLAAGTGLAPMVPILQSITDNENDETFVTLVGCFKTFESIYLKTFLQEQARFWNVRTFFVLSQESSSEQLPWSYQEKTHFGHLGQDLIKELVSCCRRKPFALVCGSAEFTKDIARCLLCAGLTEDSYFLF
ncbi:NADH-cytochrome b5 reductase-like isoform X3 [Gorilla gorilla gorilla]|uniref:NADH-cytochrome b5 reductase-like isoform X3 n=1 Tax=Gorilla gorilla gorilla TaxID=9595 RepID=UPI00156050C7|nr:NADH-cytochrome b5 reductase-like isoform X7 [Gorilla gorilla gorilla]